MSKIIFSDLDGTLINKQQHELHDGNFEAIKRFRKEGNLFVLCTGRNNIDILPTLDVADIEFDYLVLCNGASLYDSKMNCIYEKEFPLDLGKKILIECANKEGLMMLYCDEKELVLKNDYDIIIYDNKGQKHKNPRNQSFEEYVNQATCFKMLCLAEEGNGELLIECQDESLLPYEKEISWFFNQNCIDIMARDVSKGKGMKQLASMLKIADEDIYAIGDSFNDVSMIEMCQNGCTFDHCPEILKRYAKYIVSSEKELIDGILEGKF